MSVYPATTIAQQLCKHAINMLLLLLLAQCAASQMKTPATQNINSNSLNPSAS
jgi:hypothetical protein